MRLALTPLRAASAVAPLVPGPVADMLARSMALGAARLSADQRHIVERNLTRATDGRLTGLALRRAVQAAFDAYARYWVDTIRLPSLSARQVDRGFRHEGYEHITEAIERTGVGPILALPHLGGWEWAARWLHDIEGHQVAAVVEALEPPELFEWFLDLRTRLGMHIIPLGPDAATEAQSAIRAGEITCLLCDRDLPGTGIPVEFLGERTTLPGGPALLALRTGAALLPTAVYFDGSHCRGVVLPPLDTTRRGRLRDDVSRVTQELADALGLLVRQAPEQWHLFQPNWPSDFVALGRPLPPHLATLAANA